MKIPPFNPCWLDSPMSASVYEWLRNYLGLMPLRVNCWMHCWMSDAAWTEWKNYSRPRFNYVAWLAENTPYAVFKSTTLGTLSLSSSANRQHEMSIQVRKSVRRLRISKSLTSDALNVLLTSRSENAKTPWNPFVYGYADSETSGKTFWQSFARGNGKQALIDRFRAAVNRPREEYGLGVYR